MTDNKPLHIALVWHMHQPYYKNLTNGEYALPWVRLHSTKDYYDMVAMLDNYPDIHATFNLVPSLMEQILDYASNDVKEKYISMTLNPANKLSSDERIFILKNFFMANWDTMIKAYPRYDELLSKRGRDIDDEELSSIEKRFTNQEIRDLQLLFNLAWIDPYFINNDTELQRLVSKQRKYTEQDKKIVLNKHKEIMAMVLPKYKELQDRGQIEVSVSPFYHPILPLLCNTDIAKVAIPEIVLPRRNFKHPEDAVAQVKLAIEYYKNYFGRMPEGMWPSEGSVSPEVVQIISDSGIKWIATDEDILYRSLPKDENNSNSDSTLPSDVLYKPYKIDFNNKSLSIIFREHTLSDLIGFNYCNMTPEHAVNDFMAKLHKIRNNIRDKEGDHLVSVILDGENAWEYFPNDGKDFLNAFYRRLSDDPDIKTVTVSEYLSSHQPQNSLGELFAGSWINHNFGIWIGHQEDNTYWDLLLTTRQSLLAFTNTNKDNNNLKDSIESAWKELYIAEGSDWCWWYGDDHCSDNEKEFDEALRNHLINVYNFIGEKPPDELFIPIKNINKPDSINIPIGLISPVLDGKASNYFEWQKAGFYNVNKTGSTMHQIKTIIKCIHYGFDLNKIYIRLDTNISLKNYESEKITYKVRIIQPHPFEVISDISIDNKYITSTLCKYENGNQDTIKIINLENAAYAKIIEMAIPFKDIKSKSDDEVKLMLIVEKDGVEIERWPKGQPITFIVPGEDYELTYWNV